MDLIFNKQVTKNLEQEFIREILQACHDKFQEYPSYTTIRCSQTRQINVVRMFLLDHLLFLVKSPPFLHRGQLLLLADRTLYIDVSLTMSRTQMIINLLTLTFYITVNFSSERI